MYRPEGMKKNPYNRDSDTSSVVGLAEDLFNAYEAGADAMLEGLKAGGQPTDRCNGRVTRALLKRKGYLVFIPEEE